MKYFLIPLALSLAVVGCGSGSSNSQTSMEDPDLTPPAIYLLGHSEIQVIQGATYIESGASANDDIDGDLSDAIIINDEALNLNELGSYLIYYTAVDAAGNEATISRKINVIAAQEPIPGDTGDGAGDVDDGTGDADDGTGDVDDGTGDEDDGAGDADDGTDDDLLPPDNTNISDIVNHLTNAKAGERLVISAGHYQQAITITSGLAHGGQGGDITIEGEQDSNGNNLVTFDGTVDIDELAIGEWTFAEGIWQRQLQQGSQIWQLFVKQDDSLAKSDYTQMVSARWPNAKFSDGSIYLRSSWAQATDTGHNPIMKHKDLKAFSFPGTVKELTKQCFSRFASAEIDWDLNNLQQEQIEWLLAQDYQVGDKSYAKCVGISQDATVVYKPKGLSEITHDLAAENFDATGAMAILNYGHWRTWTRPVLSHSAGSAEFKHIATPEYHGKNQFYYLEDSLALLDAEEEWYFDKESKIIYFKPPNNQQPHNLTIRAKVQSFAFELKNAKHLTLKNIDFFATTIKCSSCSNITIDNTNFNYGGTSKRMLKQWANAVYRGENLVLVDAEPDNVFISSSNGYEVNSGDDYPAVNNVFKHSRVMNTDAPALHLNGKGSAIYNNHFENVDYSCTEGFPYQAAVNTYMGFDTSFSYNTLINTGCSQALRGRAGSDITHNYIRNAGWAQTDGALLGGGRQMAAAFNWTIDHKEKGLRYDAAWPPTDTSHWGTDSYAHHNVAYRTKGLVFKGWKQRIYNNTVVDQDYINPITKQADGIIPRLVIHNDTYMTKKSNAVDSAISLCVGEPLDVGGCGAGVGSLYANNLSALILGNIGKTVRRGEQQSAVGGPILAIGSNNYETNPTATDNVVAEDQQNLVQGLLRDPENYDFRPKLSAQQLIGTGADINNEAQFSKTELYANYNGLPSNVDYIGAYASDANYYPIPGQRGSLVSHPIPLDSQLAENKTLRALADTDLIWRPVFIEEGQQVTYLVYFEGELVGQYDGEQNIHFIEQTLLSGIEYQWRVDVKIDGQTRQGKLWKFKVK